QRPAARSSAPARAQIRSGPTDRCVGTVPEEQHRLGGQLAAATAGGEVVVRLRRRAGDVADRRTPFENNGGMTDTAIRLRTAAGSSRRAPEPLYGLDPAWPSTWIEHTASLDSAYPQPDGEHIVTWPPSTV